MLLETARPAHFARSPFTFERCENHVDHGEFRTRVKIEVLRHKRHLVPFALVRLTADREDGRFALEEAVATETRCTDTICRMPDGSLAMLLVHCAAREAMAVVRRMKEVSAELCSGAGVRAGVALTNGRRVEADDLWVSACTAFSTAVESQVEVVLAG